MLFSPVGDFVNRLRKDKAKTSSQIRKERIKQLKQIIKRKQKNGYETSEFEQELNQLETEDR
jgi:Tfp pilus assembly pilus retraction ATPase PilT